jgi:hypothetical protein
MLHDAVLVTLFVVPPHPKRKSLHDLKETKGKIGKVLIMGDTKIM